MSIHQFINHNKFVYYLRNYLRYYLKTGIVHPSLEKKLRELNQEKNEYICKRIDYYNRLNKVVSLPESVENLSNFKKPKRQKTYFFDCYEYTRFFPYDKKVDFTFGDITHIPDYPSIVKSRPIEGDIKNSVLLKLDKIRHFIFLKDEKRFEDKKNMLVGRMDAHQKKRVKFLEMFINHPKFDVGNINPERTEERLCKPFISKEKHLDYKFILSLEGFDVASNLKWIMSTRSLAVMPKPKYETWFMEGTLIPNYHYVLIQDDFSDVEERMEYYIKNPKEANQIADNANAYVKQFQNKRRESLISLGVLQKYFEKTGQLSGN